MTRGENFSPASFAYSQPGVICAAIGEQASASLLGEVWATPKPGLVDRNNNGAHTDMNLAMFEASAAALEKSFIRCAQAGAELVHDNAALAAELRKTGLEAEKRMYEVTGGVNTHKGAIFSMGILCAAAAMMPQKEVSMTCLQQNCREIAAALLEEDKASETHGLKAREACGTGGIRKEALSGFETAFCTGLPAIEEALESGCGEKKACVYALMRIMETTEDSNLVHRGGISGAEYARAEARRLTKDGPASMDMDAVRILDEEFIRRNLSPGGSADLLAFSVMLYRIKKGNHYD
ncbi:MAG: triphosphoribosyl-dephospho-CoA synthase [Firmicutes bacterium]|nr:triphosphoribosyl-dephospho-CoA synthase [Bacillota bacterium]